MFKFKIPQIFYFTEICKKSKSTVFIHYKELLTKLTSYENKMMLVLTAQLIVGRSCCSWLRDRTVGDTKREAPPYNH